MNNWIKSLVSRGCNALVGAQLLVEFEQKFPSKCPICSLQRWAYDHGYETSLKAPQHENCKERNGGR